MLKGAIIGFGFMGKMHYSVYSKLDEVKISAICEIDSQKRNIDDSGNIAVEINAEDFDSINWYTTIDDLLDSEKELDFVDICLPTYLHRNAVENVFYKNPEIAILCEKPISVSKEDAEKMIEIAEKMNRPFMIAQCIRFWPSYEYLYESFKEKRFGSLKSLYLERYTSFPSWNEWIKEEKKSGCILDLHIHDIDFANHLLGLPEKLIATGFSKYTDGIDEISSILFYENYFVCVNGSWALEPSFGFNMRYRAVFENATIVFDFLNKPEPVVYKSDGSSFTPEIPNEDGYIREIKYFLKCIKENTKPLISTPLQAYQSLKIVLDEFSSIKKGGNFV